MCHQGKELQDINNLTACWEFQLGQEGFLALFCFYTWLPGLGEQSGAAPAPAAPFASLPRGWRAGAAPSPQETLRPEVRQFVYWQISAENHEPYRHRCSVPCYIRVVTIP